ncbi:MAG: hypothetical protein A4E73_01332 [Syntrophaceae bacterium PtaU1.Bin231]|nr:MAG: hypothetical protein A4E73_01332 [Syntrophaceae bacterium PtaU1.Bin231]
MMTSITLPIYMLAMRPHTTPGASLNRVGPGCRPNMIKAPIRTAEVPPAGIPRLSIGTKAAPVTALFAVSGPATPAMAPFPNFSGSLESRRSIP